MGMAFLKMENIFPRQREHFPKMAGTLSQDVGNTFPKAWEYAYLKCRAAQPLPSAGLDCTSVKSRVALNANRRISSSFFRIISQSGMYASPFLDGYIRHVVQHVLISRTNDALPFKIQFFIAMGAPTHNARHGKQRSKDFLWQSDQFVNKS